MTLRSTPVIFILLFFVTALTANTTTKIAFIQNDLETAKEKAQANGKLIMVDFWADWCTPCKWMDEQTFNRPEVANYLNDNYISVRINIDNLDGIAYKTQYDVRFLPTILILKPNGKVVKKYEESMAPSKLLRILKENNQNNTLPAYVTSGNIQTVNQQPVVLKEREERITRPTPRREIKTAPTFNPATTGTSNALLANNTSNNYSAPTPTNYNSSPTKKARIRSVTNENNAEDRYREETAAVATFTGNIYPAAAPGKLSNTPNKNYSVHNNDAVSDIGLYQLNVKKAPRSGFSVQVGAYYDYKNVLTEVAKFQKAFAEEVLVHISELNGTTCYKVMLGHYKDHEEASKDKVILKEAGAQDAFVKDLASL